MVSTDTGPHSLGKSGGASIFDVSILKDLFELLDYISFLLEFKRLQWANFHLGRRWKRG